MTLAREYGAAVGTFGARLRATMAANAEAGHPNVLYGTGCRANMLLNALDLEPLLTCVVDDQPEKQGLYMPGSRLQIVAGDAIHAHVGGCFLSVNHENESKVMDRHAKYEASGGRFFSLNAPSPLLERLGEQPTEARS